MGKNIGAFLNIPKEVHFILQRLKTHGYEAFIVGGAVRNYLLEKEISDYDLTTSASVIKMKEIFSDLFILSYGEKHATISVKYNEIILEISSYRGFNIQEDLKKRDLTINTLLCDIDGNIIDMMNAYDDIEKKVIKTCSKDSFKDDPLRIMRAIRFEAELDFYIEDNTLVLIDKYKELLNKVAKKRITKEFNYILRCKAPSKIIKKHLDIFCLLMPELRGIIHFSQHNKYHIYDVLHHTMCVLDNIENKLVYRLAALFHDIGKPKVFTLDESNVGHFYNHEMISAEIAFEFLKKYKYSKTIIEQVTELIRYHDVDIKTNKKSIKKIMSDLKYINFEDLLAMKRADCIGQNPIFINRLDNYHKIEKIFKEIIYNNECYKIKMLKISGADLINLTEVININTIMKKLLDAVMKEKIKNQKENLIEYAKKIIQGLNSNKKGEKSMNVKVICLTSRSVSFELNNEFPYYNKEEFDVLLNSELIFREKRNVFSIFDLKPNTKYCLEVLQEKLEFTTLQETIALNVLDFHAFGDGVHDDTCALQAAIMCCPKGGLVYIPKGIYHTKPLFLKSDITIYLEKEAIISGDLDRLNYPILPGLISNEETGFEMNLGTWEGEEINGFASLITGINVENVTICGQGTIDGNATLSDWYQNHRVKRIAWRPFLVYFNRCANICMQGISATNSPSWNIHPYFSKNLTFVDLTITNIPTMPTTDGLDPDTCENVLITGVHFSVGDDCIAIKSGQLDFAKKYQIPCKDIIITNCLMEHGHGGVVFGSESSAGILNVRVTKCIFNKTDRGLRIKTRRGRGRYGVIDNIYFDNIVMDDVLTPFVVNMYYNMGPVGGHTEYVYTTEKLPVDERTPYIGKFHFKNMKCFNVSYSAGVFFGLPEEPIKEIILENIDFNYKSDAEPGYPAMMEINTLAHMQGLDFRYVDHILVKNVNIIGQIGEKYLLDNVVEFVEE